MTKEQWKAVEQKVLLYPYTIAKLQADGHVLSLSMQRNKMQLVIAVYVDGKIDFHWLQDECEIRRKFFQQRKRSLLTPKDRERLKRDFFSRFSRSRSFWVSRLRFLCWKNFLRISQSSRSQW